MYENLSEPVRQILSAANQEALERRHEYIGTEHILLALIAQPGSLVVTLLKNLGVPAASIQQAAESLVAAGTERLTQTKLPSSPLAQQALDYANQESRRFNSRLVKPEHLLLGLMRVKGSVAERALQRFQVTHEALSQEIMHHYGLDGMEAMEAFLALKTALGNKNLTDIEALRAATARIRQQA